MTRTQSLARRCAASRTLRPVVLDVAGAREARHAAAHAPDSQSARDFRRDAAALLDRALLDTARLLATVTGRPARLWT